LRIDFDPFLSTTGESKMKFELKEHLGPSAQQFCIDVLIEKYAAFPGEVSVDQIRQRVATIGKDPAQRERFLRTQREGFVSGGRINRSAGAGLDTTMINCFVQPWATRCRAWTATV
jgi:hypothetical protein